MRTRLKNDVKVIGIALAIFIGLETLWILLSSYLGAVREQYPDVFKLLATAGEVFLFVVLGYYFFRWFYRNIIRNQAP